MKKATDKTILKALFTRLKKKKPSNLDAQFHDLHDEVFERTDCLACGNCCKTTSPMFFDPDIQRLSSHLKMKPADFINTYLLLDTDGIYALKSSPCAFLDANNYCLVYEHRPKACREYPHTNRKRMYQVLDLTLANIDICPAVKEITEKLQKLY